MMRGDRRERRLDAEPWQVLDDRLVQVELAFLAQLQEHECEERLRDRADLEQLIGLQLALAVEIAEPISRDSLHAFAIRQHQRHARTVHVAHELLDEAIELGKQGFVFSDSGLAFLDPEAGGSRCRADQCGLENVASGELHGGSYGWGVVVSKSRLTMGYSRQSLKSKCHHSVSNTVKPSRSIARRRTCRC